VKEKNIYNIESIKKILKVYELNDSSFKVTNNLPEISKK